MNELQAKKKGYNLTGHYDRSKETVKIYLEELKVKYSKAKFIIVTVPDSEYSRGPKGTGYSIYADSVYTLYKIAENNKMVIECYDLVIGNYKREYERKCIEETKNFNIASEQYNNAIKELDNLK